MFLYRRRILRQLLALHSIAAIVILHIGCDLYMFLVDGWPCFIGWNNHLLWMTKRQYDQTELPSGSTHEKCTSCWLHSLFFVWHSIKRSILSEPCCNFCSACHEQLQTFTDYKQFCVWASFLSRFSYPNYGNRFKHSSGRVMKIRILSDKVTSKFNFHSNVILIPKNPKKTRLFCWYNEF